MTWPVQIFRALWQWWHQRWNRSPRADLRPHSARARAFFPFERNRDYIQVAFLPAPPWGSPLAAELTAHTTEDAGFTSFHPLRRRRRRTRERYARCRYERARIPRRRGPLLVVAGLASWLVTGSAWAHPDLWVNVVPGGQAGTSSENTEAFSEFISGHVNREATDLLRIRRLDVPVRLQIKLATNLTQLAVLDRRELIESNRIVCLGRIENMPESFVVLAVNHDAVAGTVWMPDLGSFQVLPAGDGLHRIGKIDPRWEIRCGVDDHTDGLLSAGVRARLAQPPPDLSSASTGSAPASNALIDVLVLYTRAARDGARGDNEIRALIDEGIAMMNVALSNSLVGARVRLVHAAEVSYVESTTMSADLNNLARSDREIRRTNCNEVVEDPLERPVAEVYRLRRQFRADLVCMITERTNDASGIDGKANVMGPNDMDANFAPRAFSVVRRAAMVNDLLLAHELAHNLGCGHASDDTERRTGAFADSRGYRFVARPDTNDYTFRTVMAGAPGSAIPYFSNPEVSYFGVPTGSTNQTNPANNAATLRRTTPTAARFSTTLRSIATPHIVAPTNGSIFVFPIALDISAVVTNRDEGILAIEFLVNDEVVGCREEPPYTIRWEPQELGTYTIRARAVGADTELSAASQNAVITIVRTVGRMEDPSWTADGGFHAAFRANADGEFVVEASPDLRKWYPLATNRWNYGYFEFNDAGATSMVRRFYRVVQHP